MQWYYSKNSNQLGPVSLDEIRFKLASGEITGTDMVWKEGMQNWSSIASVGELAVLPQNIQTGMQSDGASPYSPPGVQGGTYYYAPPTSGLAITSMVCGILGLVTCLMLPGIPAVICGHMALNRMADPSVRLGGRGMAIAGLIMGYLSLLFIVGFFMMMIVGVLSS
jgi:hypothetical protein